MKKLLHTSKQQILDKLAYLDKIFTVLADIVKSFATIIASLVAGITSGVTGYYEVKKVFKKERAQIKATHSTSSTESVRNGTTTTTETIVSTPASSNMVSVPYTVDMNSGAFLFSTVILVFILFFKFKKKTNNEENKNAKS